MFSIKFLFNILIFIIFIIILFIILKAALYHYVIINFIQNIFKHH